MFHISSLLIYGGVSTVLVFQGLVIVALLRRVDEVRLLLEQVEAPTTAPIAYGTPAPSFITVNERTGAQFDVREARRLGGLILLFLSKSCTACGGLAENLSRHGALPERLLILWDGRPEDLRAKAGTEVNFATVNARAIASAFQITQFPIAIGLSASGIVSAYSSPRDLADIERMFEVVDDLAAA